MMVALPIENPRPSREARNLIRLFDGCFFPWMDMRTLPSVGELAAYANLPELIDLIGPRQENDLDD